MGLHSFEAGVYDIWNPYMNYPNTANIRTGASHLSAHAVLYVSFE